MLPARFAGVVSRPRTLQRPARRRPRWRLLAGHGPTSPDLRSLTEREREVLILLARGFSTKEIASSLDIGVRTVETHRSNLMWKLGVKSVALLTQVAIREGILDLPAP